MNGLTAFINRPEGHELVQLGTANDQGFFKAFYVLAPGVLDQSAGRIIIDSKMIAVVQALGTGRIAVGQQDTVGGACYAMNASLQNVITMTIGVQSMSLPLLTN